MFKKKFLVLLSCLAFGIFKVPASETCPDLKLKESKEDCPWAEISRTALAHPEKKLEELHPLFKKTAPFELLKKYWGESLNFDEYEKQFIIPSPLATQLSSQFTPDKPWKEETKILHAGLQHSYGYLLSNLQTKFGFKRERWVKNILEEGFQLPSGLLGPLPSEGEFFANITYFFAKIALRNEKSLILPRSHVAKALLDFPYEKLKIQSLEEELQLKDKTLIIKTDLISFDKAVGKNAALLVYSIFDGKETKLITAFPVDAGFAEKVFDPQRLGDQQKISTRYNAWVEGVTNSSAILKGKRTKK